MGFISDLEQRSIMKKLQNSEYLNRVEDLVGKEYSVLEECIDGRTKLLTRHNYCGFEWKVSPSKFLIGRRCPKCGRVSSSNKQRKPLEQLIKEISEIENGDFSYISGIPKNNSEKIAIFHKECKRSFEIKVSNFLTRKTCPLCAIENIDRGRKTHFEFIKEMYKIHGTEYTVLGQYITSKEKILILHNCGFEWLITPTNILRNFGCPRCSDTKKSKGESEIIKFLNRNNIVFESQKRFENCLGLNKRKLTYDICVYNKQENIFCLIEYQGIQHFKSFDFFGGDEKLKYTQCHDSYKRYWCGNQDIKLLAIKYTDFKNIDSILEKELLPLLKGGN